MSATAGHESGGAGDNPFQRPVTILLEFASGLFDQFVDALNDTSMASSSRNLARFVSDRTGIDELDARAIVSACGALVTAALDSAPGASDPERGLAETVVERELGDLSQEQRELAVTRLLSVMKTSGIRVTAKSSRLQYFHERVFRSGEVVSDLRPIFSGESDNDPTGFLIWHTLRVKYTSSLPGAKDAEPIEFALDGRDLELLHGQLQRAIQKHKSLRARLEEFGTLHIEMGDLKGDADD